MHLVGRAKDENGSVYYKIKNSWGESGPYDGYLYMSESYFLMKTVGITLHKDGVPQGVLEKLK
jgi:bleomycin hydrolase